MPEGDTLHAIARKLQPLVGERVVSLSLPRSTQPTAHLVGRAVERIEAIGKNLLVHFEGRWILHTHLRMNGRWRVRRLGPSRVHALPPGSVVHLATPTYEALCVDAPVVTLARAGSLRLRALADLGPDLLAPEVDLDALVRRLRRADDDPLGLALCDQRLIAGIGNIWKSEALFALGLDPLAAVSRFADEELRALLLHTRAAMQANVDGRAHRRALVPRTAGPRVTRFAGGRALAGHAVYERAGLACSRCGGRVERVRQGTRTTYLCGRCQPRRV